jgi:SAM-dependent MidA family methyltransferase
MYNIRKKKFDRKKIKIDEDGMFIELQNLYPDIQEEAINKYGIEFNTKYFYEEISQNDLYINKINHVLNKYNIHIDYFPRSKDETGKWIITDLFLPIYITEQQKKI